MGGLLQATGKIISLQPESSKNSGVHLLCIQLGPGPELRALDQHCQIELSAVMETF